MKRKIVAKIIGAFIFSLFWLVISCDGIKNPFLEERSGDGYTNTAPETYLFLHFSGDTLISQDTTYEDDQMVVVTDTVITTLDTTASRQEIHWWGEDIDGEVLGYYYQWSYEDTATYTSEEIGTFYLPIRQKYDQFEFTVWAMDNDSIVDPTPARLTFPVYNSRPLIEFRLNSNPRAPAGNPEVTSYTFPTRTFIWDATDPDGNQTITQILWALDDTTKWNILAKEDGVVPDELTLRELEEGYHHFYVKAVDVAGAESSTIVFPDSSDDNVPNYWLVNPVRGDVLLVNDFAQDQLTYIVQDFYTDILQEITGGEFSVWEIGSESVETPINIQNSLPYSPTDIEANFSYFNKVIWFGHLGRPHLTDAGLSITKYINGGGKIFISNGNEEKPDTTWTFTDIDSVYRLNPSGRLFPGVDVRADFDGQEINEALDLTIEKLIGNRVSALIPGKTEGTDVVYFMQHSDSASVSVPYSGTPAVGVRYKPSFIQGESIYFSLPLHFCNGRENVRDLLDYILNEEFED